MNSISWLLPKSLCLILLFSSTLHIAMEKERTNECSHCKCTALEEQRLEKQTRRLPACFHCNKKFPGQHKEPDYHQSNEGCLVCKEPMNIEDEGYLENHSWHCLQCTKREHHRLKRTLSNIQLSLQEKNDITSVTETIVAVVEKVLSNQPINLTKVPAPEKPQDTMQQLPLLPDTSH